MATIGSGDTMLFFRLLRLALFTIFWSLLGCFAFFLIADAIAPDFEIHSTIALAAILVPVMGLGMVIGTIAWALFAGMPGRIFSAVDPIRSQSRDGFAILAYVEQAVRMKVPVVSILDAAAKTERGRLSERLSNLRDLLEGGVDLSVAIEREVPEISDRAVSLIAAGERTGQLQPALARLMAEADQAFEPADYDKRFAGAYIVMMLTAMGMATFFLNVFVEPKFKDIFHDFRIQMPALNRWVFDVSTAIGPAFLIAVAALVVAWMIYGLWVIIFRPRGVPRNLWELIFYMSSFFPWLGASQRNQSWADVCRVLADSFAAGWPAGVAMQQAERLALVPPIREAVRRWNAQVQTGTPIGQAAARAGLPGILVGILSASGDQPSAALDFLGRYYAHRFSRLRILLRGAVVPIAVAFFATCVCLIALSTFLPIVEMTNHIAAWVGSSR